MASKGVLFGSLALIVAGCGGTGGESEQTGTAAAAAVAPILGGFVAFGGRDNLCIGLAGPVAAGTGLQLVTCNVYDKTQGWTQQIAGFQNNILSPQSNRSLCLDSISGVPRLAACTSGNLAELYQWGYVSGGSVAYSMPGYMSAPGCLAAKNGSATVGTPIVFAPCNTSPAQTFTPYGSPSFTTLFQSAANNEWLNNIAFQWQLDTSSNGPNANMFFAYAYGEIMQWNPNYDSVNGIVNGAWECLTVTSISGTFGTLAVNPCVGGASQQWHTQLVNANGQYEWVSAVQGETRVGPHSYAAQECVQNDGTLQECNGQSNQAWFNNFNL